MLAGTTAVHKIKNEKMLYSLIAIVLQLGYVCHGILYSCGKLMGIMSLSLQLGRERIRM